MFLTLCVSLLWKSRRNKTKRPWYKAKSGQISGALGKGSFRDASPRTTEASKKHPFRFPLRRVGRFETRECEFTLETRNIVASEAKKFVSIYGMTTYFSSNTVLQSALLYSVLEISMKIGVELRRYFLFKCNEFYF